MIDFILTFIYVYAAIGVLFTGFCFLLNYRGVVDEIKRLRAARIRPLAIYSGLILSLLIGVSIWPYYLFMMTFGD